MNQPITLVEKEFGDTIEIEEQVSMLSMPTVMGHDFNKITDYVLSNESEVIDNPFVRYMDIDWEAQVKKGYFKNLFDGLTKKWHFKVSMPVSAKLNNRGDLVSTFYQTQPYVRAVHIGPYQHVGETYKAMYKWINEKQLPVQNQSIEVYCNSPDQVAQKDLETICYIPLVFH